MLVFVSELPFFGPLTCRRSGHVRGEGVHHESEQGPAKQNNIGYKAEFAKPERTMLNVVSPLDQ